MIYKIYKCIFKLRWKHFVFNLPFLPPYTAPLFSFSLLFSPHTGSFRSWDTQFNWAGFFFFFIIHLVSVFFHVQGTFTFFKKTRKKTMLSVSINLHPERVTSYQGFKSASWLSDLLSVLINSDASHTQDTGCQLLHQLCVLAFHFRNENLDYLFITA